MGVLLRIVCNRQDKVVESASTLDSNSTDLLGRLRFTRFGRIIEVAVSGTFEGKCHEELGVDYICLPRHLEWLGDCEDPQCGNSSS